MKVEPRLQPQQGLASPAAPSWPREMVGIQFRKGCLQSNPIHYGVCIIIVLY